MTPLTRKHTTYQHSRLQPTVKRLWIKVSAQGVQSMELMPFYGFRHSTKYMYTSLNLYYRDHSHIHILYTYSTHFLSDISLFLHLHSVHKLAFFFFKKHQLRRAHLINKQEI